jgi:hypothetical protein
MLSLFLFLYFCVYGEDLFTVRFFHSTVCCILACAFCVKQKRNNKIILKGFKRRDFKLCQPEKKQFWDELKRKVLKTWIDIYNRYTKLAGLIIQRPKVLCSRYHYVTLSSVFKLKQQGVKSHIVLHDTCITQFIILWKWIDIAVSVK